MAEYLHMVLEEGDDAAVLSALGRLPHNEGLESLEGKVEILQSILL